MSGIEPFCGQVVRQDMATEVVSPAYDSLNPEQRRAYRAAHPMSYLQVTRSAEDEPDAAVVDTATLVARGRAALERLVAAGAYPPTPEPAFYAYQLIDGTHEQTALVCEVPGDYYRMVAKPHEAIRPMRAALLAEHFRTVRAASSPVACAIRDDGGLEAELRSATVGEPMLRVTAGDGLEQAVWRIEDPKAQERLCTMTQGQSLFIIDGHHRSAAVEFLLGQGMQVPVLAALFPEQSLRLVGFHRLLALPPGVSSAQLLTAIARRFRVEIASDVSTVAPGTVAIAADGQFHVVHFDERPVRGGPVIRLGSLDPVVLEREILTSIVGAWGEVDLSYVPDTEPFSIIVQRAEEDGRVPIFVPPVAMADMMAVAEGGVIMPAKSTYFTPKVRSGVFLRLLHELDDATDHSSG